MCFMCEVLVVRSPRSLDPRKMAFRGLSNELLIKVYHSKGTVKTGREGTGTCRPRYFTLGSPGLYVCHRRPSDSCDLLNSLHFHYESPERCLLLRELCSRSYDLWVLNKL